MRMDDVADSTEEGMLTALETRADDECRGLSPPPQGRRDSRVSVASARRDSRVVQNDLLLHEAVIKNEAEAVKKILREPVDVNSRNNYGRAPIHWASSQGSVEIMEMLITAKCDVEVQDRYGMRPIMMAACHGHKDAAILLIKAGADVTAVNKKQQTVLMCAAKNNRKHVIDFLEETLEELQVNLTDSDDRTALHHAADGGHLEAVEKLVRMGANVDGVDKEKRTPLHCAAEKGHVDVVVFLLQMNANVSARDLGGNVPLHLAAENQQTKVIQVLLEQAHPPDVPNTKGLTALHIASELGCRGIIESLLRHGSHVNAQTKTGNTPLHLACRSDEPTVVELLVSNGADVNRINFKFESPIQVAAENGFGDICQLLLVAGANFQHGNQIFTGTKMPLYVAARSSFSAILNTIIKTAELDYPSEDDSKPEVKENVLKRVGKNWRQPNGNKVPPFARDCNERLRSLFSRVAYEELKEGEWSRLARHWNFTREQIEAIEGQNAGSSNYKERGLSALLLWAAGLPPEANPAKELREALSAVGNEKAADALRKVLEKESETDLKLTRTSVWTCLIL